MASATQLTAMAIARISVRRCNGGVRGRSELPGYVENYMKGVINIDDMVTHTMGLDEINRAFDLMHEGKSIRSVVIY